MVQLPSHTIAISVVENIAKYLGITSTAKRLLRRGECGGVRWSELPLADNVDHVRLIANSIAPSLADIEGQIGAEIGPGDNIGAAHLLLKRGARKIYAIEKFGSVSADRWCERLLRSLDETDLRPPSAAEVLTDGDFNPTRLRVLRSTFEEFSPGEPLDFIFSYDVLEHVNPSTVFPHARKLLRSGGRFVNIVDFTGHGPFYNLERPLDFLTCPDWLWSLMFSAMETTNRVRLSEMVDLARREGFVTTQVAPIRRARPEYLSRIRPHLLPRYQQLHDEDLSVMQCLLSFTRP